MKRSYINEILQEADGFIRSFGFSMPPFAYLTPAQMQAQGAAVSALVSARMGWDITDYGLEDFRKTGLFLFTLRNGADYAEKIMVSRQGQISPLHRHGVKTEDIINRGGAMLAIEMFTSTPNGALDPEAKVQVRVDGVARTLPAGGILQLAPGESVTLAPGNWHAFWGEGGDVLIGEVSTVNDDLTDNIFHAPIGRFATVEEDEAPLHLLVSDYEKWLGTGISSFASSGAGR